MDARRGARETFQRRIRLSDAADTNTRGLHFLRGALLVASSALAFLSLRHMPVGELAAIVMLTPLMLGAWLVFSHRPDGWSVLGVATIAVRGAFGTWLTAREAKS